MNDLSATDAAGVLAGIPIGRAKQRAAHSFAVWKGHPR